MLVSIWMRSDWTGAVMGCSFPPQYTLGTVGGQGLLLTCQVLSYIPGPEPQQNPVYEPRPERVLYQVPDGEPYGPQQSKDHQASNSHAGTPPRVYCNHWRMRRLTQGLTHGRRQSVSRAVRFQRHALPSSII